MMASEPGLRARVYLIAFGTDGEHSYLALGADLSPVHDRRLVRRRGEPVKVLGDGEFTGASAPSVIDALIPR